MWGIRRQKMVDEQIIARGIKDKRVIEAMKEVPRHLFVPEMRRIEAYDDRPLPIGRGQTISQPYIVAYMVEALKLKGDERVLEIGTGSGYEAAVLSKVVKDVTTIELLDRLAGEAEDRLQKMGYSNIEVVRGDGYRGCLQKAPYDAVILSAAPPEIPEELVKQLVDGGRMILPVGQFIQKLILIKKSDQGKISIEELLPVMFVPMVRGE